MRIAVIILTLAWSGSLGAQPAGIRSEWDIRSTLDAISSHAGRLLPVLEQVRPRDWVEKGASETYIQQFETCRIQTEAIRTVAANLGREPEKLTVALDTFLRLQGLETMLGSLAEGVRRYQNPALADLLGAMVAENNRARQQLHQYVVDLVALKEQEFDVMAREAQRCRSILTRQPRPVQKKNEGNSQK